MCHRTAGETQMTSDSKLPGFLETKRLSGLNVAVRLSTIATISEKHDGGCCVIDSVGTVLHTELSYAELRDLLRKQAGWNITNDN